MQPRHSRRRERGSIIPLASTTLLVIIISVSFAVDLGRLRVERREVQAAADVISLDLVRLADGRTEGEILDDPTYDETLARSADANDVDVADVEPAYGIYDQDTDTFVETDTDQVPDAVRVGVHGKVDYAFASVFTDGDGQTRRRAVSALDSVADLSIGSRMAHLRSGDADRLNFLLENRIGGPEFTFTTTGYQGLAATTITWEDIVVSGGFASPDAFLDAQLTLAEFADASAYAFDAAGEDDNAAIAVELADRAEQREIDLDRDSATFTARDILQVEVGGSDQWATATANVFDLFIAAAEAINGDNLTKVCTTVPGWDDRFADVDRSLIDFEPTEEILDPSASTCTSTLESPRWITGGRPGSSARTSQLRATQTGEGDIDIAGLAGRAVVPAEMSAAGARADLDAIRCDADTGDHRTDTFVTPKPLSVQIGHDGAEFQLTDGLVVVSVDIDAQYDPAADAAELIADQAIGTVVAGPGTTPTLGFRLGHADVDVVVETGTLPIAMSDFLDLLVPRLNVLLAQLDHRSTPFLEAFGIAVADSDLYLHDVRCDTPLVVK